MRVAPFAFSLLAGLAAGIRSVHQPSLCRKKPPAEGLDPEEGECCGYEGEISCKYGAKLVAPSPGVCDGACTAHGWCDTLVVDGKSVQSYQCMARVCVDQRAAAENLGYTQLSWDNVSGTEEQPAIASKTKWSQLSDEEKADAAILGYTEEAWNAQELSVYWDDLNTCDACVNERAIAEKLGYTKLSWDNLSLEEELPAVGYKYWDQLSVVERTYAVALSYTQEVWDYADAVAWDELVSCECAGIDQQTYNPVHIKTEQYVYVKNDDAKEDPCECHDRCKEKGADAFVLKTGKKRRCLCIMDMQNALENGNLRIKSGRRTWKTITGWITKTGKNLLHNVDDTRMRNRLWKKQEKRRNRG